MSFGSIPVSNQDRSFKFDTEKLGFEVLTEQPTGSGIRCIQHRPPRVQTDVILFLSPGYEDRIGAFQRVSFTCEDVVGAGRLLKERGVEFLKHAGRAIFGGFEAILTDPDGNTFASGSPNE